MKQKMRWGVVIAAASLLGAVVRADAESYARIVKEREAVLEELLAMRESRYKVGGGTADAVFAARLSLLTFRRDTATSLAEKLKQQELIAKAHEKRLEEMEARVKAGLADPEERLAVKDQVLEAKQTLEAMKEEKKTG